MEHAVVSRAVEQAAQALKMAVERAVAVLSVDGRAPAAAAEAEALWNTDDPDLTKKRLQGSLLKLQGTGGYAGVPITRSVVASQASCKKVFFERRNYSRHTHSRAKCN